MIPAIVHIRFELHACIVKRNKLSDAPIPFDTEKRIWLFTELKTTIQEIAKLKTLLRNHPKPFTSLKYYSKHV